jgi:surface protein
MAREIKETINIRVSNNTSFTQNVNLLGGTADPLGVPPHLLYQWDLSSETYFGSVTASIVISNTSNPTPVTYTVQVDGYNIQAVAFALNSLNMGVFQISGNIIYVSNDYYIYGALEVTSNLFVSTWDTTLTSGGSSASNQIALPLVSNGIYDFIVDWGDGSQDTITSWNQAETTHTYATSGTYTVSIAGTINGFVFGGSGDLLKLLSIGRFGTIVFGDSLLGIFSGCQNLDLTSVVDTPNLSSMTRVDNMFEDCTFSTINNLQNWDVSNIVEFESMFRNCSNFNQNISSWDVSGANSLVRMFNGASVFNSPLNSWNVSNVTTLNGIFNGASAFNQNLNSWDVSNVVDMTDVFRNASAFNGNITSWNVSNVTTMYSMFVGASTFNQNIGSWDVSSVTNMFSLFSGAFAFNQNIGSWDVSAVTNMSFMFYSTSNFNQNLNLWNTGNVTNMENMFGFAPLFNGNIGTWNTSSVIGMSAMFIFATNFNQSLNSWNTSNVTDMSYMFLLADNFDGNIASWNTSNVTSMSAMFSSNAGVFNQNISGWNVSNVVDFSSMFVGQDFFNQPIGSWNTGNADDMNNMFNGAGVFNQVLSSWNVSNVTNMRQMFINAIAFNQNIGSWDISSVANFVGFMGNKTNLDYSSANLDSIYNGWSLLPVQPNLTINFGSIKYTVAGQAGKNILDFAPNNWTIVDGGI